MSGRTTKSALLVGIGGLGAPAAMALAHAGVAAIGIADDDRVELSNLHRQIVFEPRDVGSPKVDAAVSALRRLAPSMDVRGHRTRLLPDNAVDLVGRYDIVLEGSDNFATKFLTADACRVARVPVIHAAAVRWHGTVLAVAAGGRPCYRCLFEDMPVEYSPNCAEAGVMGPVVGIVGALQADLALAMLDGRDVAGTLVTFDGRTDVLRRRTVMPRKGCGLCGAGAKMPTLDASRYAAVACDA